jgi:class 3 adenylate cyclase/tetratricopeptide (TPR) repeat protein
MCPSADEAMARWWGERCRAAASPGAIKALMEMNSRIDVRALLRAIRVPTLVVNRGTDFDVRVEEGRYIAERIPGARVVELPGADHFVAIDSDQVLDAVEPFVAEGGAAPAAAHEDRALATLLVIDTVDATHRPVVRAELARFRGREVDASPGGILATFDGPARAVRCATAIVRALRPLGLSVGAGVHTGEVEATVGRIRGVAVDIAARVAAEAGPGEVLVTHAVDDLVAGSGLQFADRDSRSLPGVPGEWRLLAVVDPDSASDGFLGRTRELERLEAVLQATASGAGATVLVRGDAGIGKTRLVSELGTRAVTGGFEVVVGRCLDLVGTELPYQPFADALRRVVHELPWVDGRPARSQLRVFEETLAVLDGLTAAAPLMLVLEDLHWADPSTLDLVVFLAHNVDDRRVFLLATYRADEPAAAERMRQVADGVRRSGSGLLVELGPLDRDEVTGLLAARAGAPPSAALTNTIVARSEGNPLFAEELLAAAGDETDELPRGLRDLLLARVMRLDPETQGLLRLAAAAGRDVGYPLLCAAGALPERDVRESLRRAVEHGVLVPEQATGSYRFRHALLAEAVYTTLLPGEREELHARLAEELARGAAPAAAAELAPHWAAAGRPAEALAASVEAARETEAVFGLAEALAHLERALALWVSVPDAADIAGLDLAGLSSWAAELAFQVGAAPRAVELGRHAVELVGESDPPRAGLLHERLGRYHLVGGSRDAGLAAFERAVDLVPAHPLSPERAQVLAALGHALMLLWRHHESRRICEEALELARVVGARRAEFRALGALGVDLAYLGRGDEGLAQLWTALRLAEEDGVPEDLSRAYILLTDALTMLGRPRESARLAAAGLDVVRPYGIEHGTLVSNRIEALVASGDWDDAGALSAAALRALTANWPHHVLVVCAELEIGRGRFDDAREHLEVALATVREDVRGSWPYDFVAIELALWERRWTDAERSVHDALKRARSNDSALVRVQLCAQGLRAQAELGRPTQKLLATARRAATQAEVVTPNAGGWRALAEAEYARARGRANPAAWSQTAVAWDRLERPPLAAYCRWRQAEALVAAGAPPSEASVPLTKARDVAARIGARPLLRELELLAERARLDLAPR